MTLPRFHVVIPSRYGATRLPGKPLRSIAGRPMIEHVYARGTEAGATTVCVATDDERIVNAVNAFGGTALMTSPDHTSGTDRLAEVSAQRQWPDGDIVVNLQGDEPCMDPKLVALVARILDEEGGDLATLATPVRSAADLFSANTVKVIIDDGGLARWFTRAPVPWVRGAFEPTQIADTLPEGVPFLRHLGIYAYRVGVLKRICAAPPHPHEQAESLEQLRALAMGLSIRVGVVADAPGHGVDTEADLARAEAALSGAAAIS